MILIAELISHYVNGNANMATIKKISKAQNGRLTPARTRQVADSLEKESNSKKDFYSEQKRMANAAIKNKAGDKELGSTYGFGWKSAEKIPTGNERLKKANEQLKSASTDSANAARYRALADKAEGKKPQMKKGGKITKAKAGKQMLKRADGSYSQRGLWDNIRAAKGSGKKPTAAMLKQERKIKAKTKNNGNY